jgi:hypothetical protein
MKPSIEYIAGFFDGEGHASIICDSARPRKGPCYRIQLAITNTDVRPLMACRRLFGGSIHTRHKASRLSRKIVYQWYLSSRRAAQFLSVVLPHLIIKAEKARLALQLQRHIDGRHPGKYRPLSLGEIRRRESIRLKIKAA